MARFLTPYELNSIDGVLTDRQYPTPKELQSSFSDNRIFGGETINLDELFPDLRIGAFVSHKNNAKPTTGRGYSTRVFYPGGWKDKATVEFDNLKSRRVGEDFSQPTSNAGKVAAELKSLMQLMKDKRERLFEWISAEIMIKGKYTAVSELHPAVEIDLQPNIATDAASLNGGRANRANLTSVPVNGWPVITDNGGAGKRAWDSTGGTNTISPVADLQQMLDSMWETAEKIYISEDAWKKLVKDPDIDKLLSTQVTTMSSLTVDLLPKQETHEGLKLRGFIGMQSIPIYTYTAQYEDVATGNLVKYIPDGYVIIMPSSRYGVKTFGPIYRQDADMGSFDIFWNSWMEEESGLPWLQGQTNFAFIHTKINSTACWKVM